MGKEKRDLDLDLILLPIKPINLIALVLAVLSYVTCVLNSGVINQQQIKYNSFAGKFSGLMSLSLEWISYRHVGISIGKN